MSGRIFQNVVLQFKETTDRTIGVIDSEGTVIACSELTGIGKGAFAVLERGDIPEEFGLFLFKEATIKG